MTGKKKWWGKNKGIYVEDRKWTNPARQNSQTSVCVCVWEEVGSKSQAAGAGLVTAPVSCVWVASLPAGPKQVLVDVCVCACLWVCVGERRDGKRERWWKVSCHVDEVIRLAASEARLAACLFGGSGLISHCTFSCSVISHWWAKSPKTHTRANFSPR